jgi:hypothetical protein
MFGEGRLLQGVIERYNTATIANSKELQITGVGNSFQTYQYDNRKKTIELCNVLVVPGLTKSLPSVKSIVASRVDVIFKGGSVPFNKGVVNFPSRRTHSNSFTMRIYPRVKAKNADMDNAFSWH